MVVGGAGEDEDAGRCSASLRRDRRVRPVVVLEDCVTTVALSDESFLLLLDLVPREDGFFRSSSSLPWPFPASTTLETPHKKKKDPMPTAMNRKLSA